MKRILSLVVCLGCFGLLIYIGIKALIPFSIGGSFNLSWNNINVWPSYYLLFGKCDSFFLWS